MKTTVIYKTKKYGKFNQQITVEVKQGQTLLEAVKEVDARAVECKSGKLKPKK